MCLARSFPVQYPDPKETITGYRLFHREGKDLYSPFLMRRYLEARDGGYVVTRPRPFPVGEWVTYDSSVTCGLTISPAMCGFYVFYDKNSAQHLIDSDEWRICRDKVEIHKVIGQEIVIRGYLRHTYSPSFDKDCDYCLPSFVCTHMIICPDDQL